MSYTNLIFSRFDFILLQIVLQETEIMNQGKTVFAQIISLIPRYEFDKCVKRYNGNRHAIEFKCRDQFMVMSFAQFTDQVSLRSIADTLRMVIYEDYATGNVYRFLSNDFTHSYLTVAEFYRERWQVECFFKWIICCLSLLRRYIVLIKIFIYYRPPLVKSSLKGNL